MKLVKAIELDINDGFNKVVESSLNEILVELQKDDTVKNIVVSIPFVNGRKVYYTIQYDKDM